MFLCINSLLKITPSHKPKSTTAGSGILLIPHRFLQCILELLSLRCSCVALPSALGSSICLTLSSFLKTHTLSVKSGERNISDYVWFGFSFFFCLKKKGVTAQGRCPEPFMEKYIVFSEPLFLFMAACLQREPEDDESDDSYTKKHNQIKKLNCSVCS